MKRLIKTDRVDKKERSHIVKTFIDILDTINDVDARQESFKYKHREWSKSISVQWKSLEDSKLNIYKSLESSQFVKVVATAIFFLSLLENIRNENISVLVLGFGLYLLLLAMDIVSFAIASYYCNPDKDVSHILEYFEDISLFIPTFSQRVIAIQEEFHVDLQHELFVINTLYKPKETYELKVKFSLFAHYNVYGVALAVLFFVFSYEMQFDILEQLESIVFFFVLFIALIKDTNILTFARQIKIKHKRVKLIHKAFKFWFENKFEHKSIIIDAKIKDSVLPLFHVMHSQIFKDERNLSFAIFVDVSNSVLERHLLKDNLEKMIFFLLYGNHYEWCERSIQSIIRTRKHILTEENSHQQENVEFLSKIAKKERHFNKKRQLKIKTSTLLSTDHQQENVIKNSNKNISSKRSPYQILNLIGGKIPVYEIKTELPSIESTSHGSKYENYFQNAEYNQNLDVQEILQQDILKLRKQVYSYAPNSDELHQEVKKVFEQLMHIVQISEKDPIPAAESKRNAVGDKISDASSIKNNSSADQETEVTNDETNSGSKFESSRSNNSINSKTYDPESSIENLTEIFNLHIIGDLGVKELQKERNMSEELQHKTLKPQMLYNNGQNMEQESEYTSDTTRYDDNFVIRNSGDVRNNIENNASCGNELNYSMFESNSLNNAGCQMGDSIERSLIDVNRNTAKPIESNVGEEEINTVNIKINACKNIEKKTDDEEGNADGGRIISSHNFLIKDSDDEDGNDADIESDASDNVENTAAADDEIAGADVESSIDNNNKCNANNEIWNSDGVEKYTSDNEKINVAYVESSCDCKVDHSTSYKVENSSGYDVESNTGESVASDNVKNCAAADEEITGDVEISIDNNNKCNGNDEGRNSVGFEKYTSDNEKRYVDVESSSDYKIDRNTSYNVENSTGYDVESNTGESVASDNVKNCAADDEEITGDVEISIDNNNKYNANDERINSVGFEKYTSDNENRYVDDVESSSDYKIDCNTSYNVENSTGYDIESNAGDNEGRNYVYVAGNISSNVDYNTKGEKESNALFTKSIIDNHFENSTGYEMDSNTGDNEEIKEHDAAGNTAIKVEYNVTDNEEKKDSHTESSICNELKNSSACNAGDNEGRIFVDVADNISSNVDYNTKGEKESNALFTKSIIDNHFENSTGYEMDRNTGDNEEIKELDAAGNTAIKIEYNVIDNEEQKDSHSESSICNDLKNSSAYHIEINTGDNEEINILNVATNTSSSDDNKTPISEERNTLGVESSICNDVEIISEDRSHSRSSSVERNEMLTVKTHYSESCFENSTINTNSTNAEHEIALSIKDKINNQNRSDKNENTVTSTTTNYISNLNLNENKWEQLALKDNAKSSSNLRENNSTKIHFEIGEFIRLNSSKSMPKQRLRNRNNRLKPQQSGILEGKDQNPNIFSGISTTEDNYDNSLDKNDTDSGILKGQDFETKAKVILKSFLEGRKFTDKHEKCEDVIFWKNTELEKHLMLTPGKHTSSQEIMDCENLYEIENKSESAQLDPAAQRDASEENDIQVQTLVKDVEKPKKEILAERNSPNFESKCGRNKVRRNYSKRNQENTNNEVALLIKENPRSYNNTTTILPTEDSNKTLACNEPYEPMTCSLFRTTIASNESNSILTFEKSNEPMTCNVSITTIASNESNNIRTFEKSYEPMTCNVSSTTIASNESYNIRTFDKSNEPMKCNVSSTTIVSKESNGAIPCDKSDETTIYVTSEKKAVDKSNEIAVSHQHMSLSKTKFLLADQCLSETKKDQTLTELNSCNERNAASNMNIDTLESVYEFAAGATNINRALFTMGCTMCLGNDIPKRRRKHISENGATSEVDESGEADESSEVDKNKVSEITEDGKTVFCVCWLSTTMKSKHCMVFEKTKKNIERLSPKKERNYENRRGSLKDQNEQIKSIEKANPALNRQFTVIAEGKNEVSSMFSMVGTIKNDNYHFHNSTSPTDSDLRETTNTTEVTDFEEEYENMQQKKTIDIYGQNNCTLTNYTNVMRDNNSSYCDSRNQSTSYSPLENQLYSYDRQISLFGNGEMTHSEKEKNHIVWQSNLYEEGINSQELGAVQPTKISNETNAQGYYLMYDGDKHPPPANWDNNIKPLYSSSGGSEQQLLITPPLSSSSDLSDASCDEFCENYMILSSEVVDVDEVDDMKENIFGIISDPQAHKDSEPLSNVENRSPDPPKKHSKNDLQIKNTFKSDPIVATPSDNDYNVCVQSGENPI